MGKYGALGIDNFKLPRMEVVEVHTPMALKQSLERLGKSFLQVHPLAVDDDRAGHFSRHVPVV
jgi:hypothetical protein